MQIQQLLPKLDGTEFTISPSPTQLAELVRRGGASELKRVANFSVTHKSWGSVRWLEPVDIRALRLKDVIEIGKNNVSVSTRKSFQLLFKMCHACSAAQSCNRMVQVISCRSGLTVGRCMIDTHPINSCTHSWSRPVQVYPPQGPKKPPMGEGLNKPAEVALYKIFRRDSKGEIIRSGEELQKFVHKLRVTASKQSSEYIGYDEEKGVWRFRVEHFSRCCC